MHCAFTLSRACLVPTWSRASSVSRALLVFCVNQGISASLSLSLSYRRLQTTRFWSIKGPQQICRGISLQFQFSLPQYSIFSRTMMFSSSFYVLTCHSYILLGEVPAHIFCPFFIGLFPFLLLSFGSSLYILYTSLLSDKWFEIFSYRSYCKDNENIIFSFFHSVEFFILMRCSHISFMENVF